MRYALLTALSAMSVLSGADVDPLSVDPHVAHQLVLGIGLPVGMFSGEVTQPHPIIGSFTHELESEWQPGVAASLAWQRTSWNADGDGWHIEIGLAAEEWNGTIVADEINGASTATSSKLTVQAGLVTLAIGPTWRWDGDHMRVWPKLWQLDLAPTIGFGVASATIGDGDPSSLGPVYSLGARVRLTAALGEYWRIGGQIGAAWSEAQVHWTNTEDSTFRGFGPTAGLVLIFGE